MLSLGLAVLAFPPPAAAYIDPLSGAPILQVIATGVLSFGFTMKGSVQWLGGRWNADRNNPPASMNTEPLGGPLRDPSGVVFRRDGKFFRQFNHPYQPEWAAFESFGLLAALWRGHLIIEHTDVDAATGLTPDACTEGVPARTRSLLLLSRRVVLQTTEGARHS